MDSNPVCNHTSDWQNQVTMKWEFDLLILSMITDRIRQHKVLLPMNQNCDKIWERKKLDFAYTFYKKKQ